MATAKAKTTKGWRSKLRATVDTAPLNFNRIESISKKNRRTTTSTEPITPLNLLLSIPETNKSITSTDRTDVRSSDSLSVSANTTTQLSSCDCDRDDDDAKNKITTEQSNTEVDGEKKKRHAGYSLRNAIEYGRKMGWLPMSTGKSTDKNSDTNTTKLPADESESQEYVSQVSLGHHHQEYKTGRLSLLDDPLEYGRQMGWLPTSTRTISGNCINLLPANKDETESKGEGAKTECVNQGSLEYYQEYYSQMENNSQTRLELVKQKKSCVVCPSALEYGRQMGWVP